MKNTFAAKMLLAVALVCTLAHAEDYSEKIKETVKECDKILDGMFFADPSNKGNSSIEHYVRASRKIVYSDYWQISTRRHRIQKQISNLGNDAAAEEALKLVETGIEKRTKKLISLIPYDVSAQVIDMNYNQLVNLPYVLCRNGLKSKESDCEEIHQKMSQFADEIAAQRSEAKPY